LCISRHDRPLEFADAAHARAKQAWSIIVGLVYACGKRAAALVINTSAYILISEAVACRNHRDADTVVGGRITKADNIGDRRG
jgi:hypothetical protein